MKNPKFQVFVGRKKQYYFRLLARNGEIILGSEGYTSKRGCLKGHTGRGGHRARSRALRA